MYTKIEAGMTVAVILHNGRKNKAGDYPLYLRITQNGKRIYKATGISVRERDWNRRRREPAASCPNREEIMLLIATIKKRVIEDMIKRYEEEDFVQVKPNKPGSRYLSLSIGGTMSRKEFYDLHQIERQRELICLFDDYIQQLKENGELEYISGLTAAKDAFTKYAFALANGYPTWGIPITGITKEWLRKAEKALLNDGENKNTVEGYMRALRIVYDYAVEKGLVTCKDYPFPYHENFTSPLETVSKKLVARLFDDFIQHIKEKGGSEYISGLTAAKDALIIANGGNLNIPITDVTKDWLRKMDAAMLKSGVNKSLVKRYMEGALKAVYEYAIEKGLVTREDYPFPYHENFTSLLGTISKEAEVAGLFDDRIEQLEKEDRLGNAGRMKIARSAFAKANGGNLNFPISEITEDWLRKMEKALFESGVKSNTVETYMRALRAIYNIAIEKKLVTREDYPFDRYKISKLKEETAHRALSHEDIQKVLNCPYPPPSPSLHKTGDNILYEQFALDLLRFSYYTGGMDISSIANIRQENVLVGGELHFRRVKTKKRIQIPLRQEASAIIEKYRKPTNDYIFPILDSNVHKDAKQKKNRIHDVNSRVNDHLKKIGKELGLPIKLTTYVARHSFASEIARKGEQTRIIMQIMGHSSEQMTQKYIDSFGSETLRQAFDKL